VSSPYTAAETAARDAAAARLAGHDALTVSLAGRTWHCTCGSTIRRGDVCVQIEGQSFRNCEPCAVAMWEAFQRFGPSADVVDLDALGEAS